MTSRHNKAKYSVGTILQLNSDNALKQKIISICYEFYDETGLSDEIYYYVKLVNNDNSGIPVTIDKGDRVVNAGIPVTIDKGDRVVNYPPSPIKESAIDQYYSKPQL